MSREQRRALDTELHANLTGPADPSIEATRQWFAELMSAQPKPAGIRTSEQELGGRPALEVLPAREPRPGTILYFHGGSNLVGSPQTALGLTGELVERTGYRAVSVDYRLAPEHPFPAGIQDAVAAYRELLEAGAEPASVAFAGDSAGGLMTVTAALAAREAGLPVPAGLLAFSPSLDYTRSGATMATKEGIDPWFTRESLGAMGEIYLAGADPHQPLLSPALTGDLTGFPPVYLSAGANEVLLDDSVRFADRAREQDVDVILDVVADAPHVFVSSVHKLDEAGEALDRAALFLSQRLR